MDTDEDEKKQQNSRNTGQHARTHNTHTHAHTTHTHASTHNTHTHAHTAHAHLTLSYPSRLDKEEAEKERQKYRITPNNLGKAIGNQLGLLASLNGTMGVSSSTTQSRDKYGRSSRDRLYSAGGGLFADRHPSNYRSQYTYGLDDKNAKPDPKKLEEEWGKEWRRLAEVVDRLFFWIFLSAIVITTLLLFHPLTKAYFSLLGDETILGKEDQPET